MVIFSTTRSLRNHRSAGVRRAYFIMPCTGVSLNDRNLSSNETMVSFKLIRCNLVEQANQIQTWDVAIMFCCFVVSNKGVTLWLFRKDHVHFWVSKQKTSHRVQLCYYKWVYIPTKIPPLTIECRNPNNKKTPQTISLKPLHAS
jgi:hypothetical protein